MLALDSKEWQVNFSRIHYTINVHGTSNYPETMYNWTYPTVTPEQKELPIRQVEHPSIHPSIIVTDVLPSC